MTLPLKDIRRIEVELPEEAFAHHPGDAHQLARELRILWLLEQVRQRRIAFTKAAQLADLPLGAFLQRMGDLQITPFDYDDEELADELV